MVVYIRNLFKVRLENCEFAIVFEPSANVYSYIKYYTVDRYDRVSKTI